jgi:hypothetical protein
MTDLRDLEERIATADTTPLTTSGVAGSTVALEYESPTFGVSLSGDDLGDDPYALVFVGGEGSAALSLIAGGAANNRAEMSLTLEDVDACRSIAAQLLAAADRLEQEADR